MKRVIFISALIFAISFIGCKKDKIEDDDVVRNNEVECNGNTYEIKAGLIYIGELENGERESTIALYSSGIKYDLDFSGSGNLFYFEGLIHTLSDIQGTYLAYDWENEPDAGGPGFIDEVEFGITLKSCGI